MKNTFTKKQYDTLLKAVAIAGYMYGTMEDLEDRKYNEITQDIDEVEAYLLKFADDFKIKKSMVEVIDKKSYLSDEYIKTIADDINTYNEMEFIDSLSKYLAKRDMQAKFSEAQLEEMTEDEYMSEFYRMEQRYIDEFEKNGINNLKISL